MNDDSTSSTRSRALWILAGAILLIAAVVINHWFFGITLIPSALPPEVPLASARFGDGFEVRVLRAELKTNIRFDLPPPAGIWGRFSVSSGSHGWGTTGLMVYVRQERGAFSGASFEFQPDKPVALMLVLRGIESDGRVFANREFMTPTGRHLLDRKDGTFVGITEVTHPSDRAENMPLHLQVEDGAGGWRDMEGPIIIDEKDGRGFAGVCVFPRRKPDLKLRALRIGQAPVEMTIPNPGYKPSFPVLTPQPVPIVHQGADFTVTCEGLEWRKRGRGLSLDAKIHLAQPSLPKDSLWGTPAFFDATGNELIDNSYVGRAAPLPGETVCRVVYSVQRNAAIYPWPESEAVLIATGTLSPPGASQAAELTTEGRALGFTDIEFHTPAAGEVSRHLDQFSKRMSD